MKKNKSSKLHSAKIIVPLSMFFSSIICVSIGFSAWVVPATGDNTFISGDFEADNVETLIPVPDDLDVISFVGQLSSYRYAQGYGFLVDETFVNNTTLSGTCSFNSENARKCFTSYRDNNDKSFQLEIRLRTALSGGFSGNSFVSDSITVSSSNFTNPTQKNQDPTDSTYLSTTFVLVCLDNTSDFNFTFSTNIRYTGSLSSFPNLSSAAFSIELAPKENATT